MTRNRWIIAVVAIGILALTVAFAVHSQAAYGGQQWEYLWAKPAEFDNDVYRPKVGDYIANDEVVQFNGSAYEWMDTLGADGWEFTQLMNGFFVFKRPKL